MTVAPYSLGLILHQITSSSLQACPDDLHVVCATEGRSCDVTDTFSEGFMSYDTSSRCSYISFTNSKTDGTGIIIE